MTEAEALLAAILADPADDLARLVYADWLDDRGESERAEFVRVQCELARLELGCRCDADTGYYCEWCGGADPLRRREQELWNAGGPRLLNFRTCLPLSYDATHPSGPADTPLAVVRRGFVDEIRLQRQAFAGGPCESAGCRLHPGSPVYRLYESAGPESRWVKCPTCHGTGSDPGHAAELFRSHPVMTVRLVDRVPLQRAVTGWSWQPAHTHDLADGLPEAIYRRLEGGQLSMDWTLAGGGIPVTIYPTAVVALAALSAACVWWVRDLAGLPPLPARSASLAIA